MKALLIPTLLVGAVVLVRVFIAWRLRAEVHDPSPPVSVPKPDAVNSASTEGGELPTPDPVTVGAALAANPRPMARCTIGLSGR